MLTTTGRRSRIAAAALLTLGATVIDVPATWADEVAAATAQFAVPVQAETPSPGAGGTGKAGRSPAEGPSP
jgi:hypothetical protein